jgi:hypothetical protein
MSAVSFFFLQKDRLTFDVNARVQANDNEVSTSEVRVSPRPSHLLQGSCEGKDASKISFNFPKLFLLQGYQNRE